MLKLAAVLAAVVSLAGAAPLAETAAGGSHTVAATADAFVNAGSPTSNYGGDPRLYTDGSPVFRSYLRFDLTGLSGQVVTKATLQIHAETAGASGETIEVRRADSSWTEDGITYANAPSPGAVVDSAGPVSAGSWVSLDVTPLVDANGPVTFVVDSQDDTRIRFASRETSTPPQLVVETTAAAPQPTFPIRAAFYYPWFPEAWTQQGLTPFTHYTPSLGFYSSSDSATVDAHLAAMSAARVDSAIASWWGQGAKSEDTRIPLLLSRIAATGSSLRLALYYEPEGQGDPSVSQIVSDLQYIQSRYASDPGYLRIGGRFVVFAYDGGPSDGPTSCELTDRWKQANDAIGDAAFVVLKSFAGFKNCGSQPDGWHQYAPANAESSQTPWSYAISPGFWLATDATPRLARNPSTWNQNVLDMLNSDAAFQLVTTFNEWGEGTAVESSTTWGTAYLDALATNGGGFPTAVAPGSPNPGPTLAGVVRTGGSLTVVPGSWPGTPGTFTYQFRRCDSAGGSCVDIPGATSGSYVLGPEDVGATIRAFVTDTNGAGAKSSLSEPSAIVPADALPSTTGACGTQAAPPATWSHVVWIFFENHAYGQVVGSASAPYLTSVANACGLATNYAGVAHPSLPNYIAATSGGTQGITDDNPPTSANHYLNVPNIYQQVQSAGGTWRDFEESSPGNCPNGSSGLYAVKHDPAAYYSNIATTCATSDVPLGSLTGGNLANALVGGGLPSFSFVTPNLCNDMHDCSVAAGDDWLRAWLPRLLASPDYRSGSTAVFITFDENDNSAGNIVPAIVISPSTAAGTVSTAAFTHYSLLRTSEELLGLAPIGNAATAASMASAFGLR
jgi:phosphatidylinositol-3-phosphatase